MKHFTIFSLLLASICFADINKIGNHFPRYLDNNLFEAKLLSNDAGNNRGVGFGVSCFNDEFYSELYKVFNDDGDVDGEFRGNISGNFDGYYEFSAILKNDGFHWEMEKEDY